MNAQKLTMTAAVLTLGMFAFEDSALAQNGCKQIKAQAIGTYDPSTDTTPGTVTNGGKLNGTYLAVFGRRGAVPTQDPTTISFTSDYTITTNEGQLKAYNVYLYNFAGVAVVLGRINPIASTGIFAGATGVLYSAVKFDPRIIPSTFYEDITGEICYAKGAGGN